MLISYSRVLSIIIKKESKQSELCILAVNSLHQVGVPLYFEKV